MSDVRGSSRRILTFSIRPVRQAAGLAVGAIGLPIITVILTRARPHLALIDDVLVYLFAVVAVTLIGGFWSAIVAAVESSLLLNWFFTPPLHTWTVESPQNLLALLLFVAIAVTVSAVVHLAAQRAVLARQFGIETQRLMDLARTVLGGADTADAVLDHLTGSTRYRAELLEFVSGRWVRVAGQPIGAPSSAVVPVRENLRMDVVHPPSVAAISRRLLEGYANQAAAALDRERLRAQAAQAEALAEADRMRTALLAAVSHDLRTPLASVKAAVSSLRQHDVAWSAADEEELLATVEEGADRLNSLISNLLDMSRIQTGNLQPFLRPLALDEVAPLALRGLEGGEKVRFDIPDDLPLINTDAVLLERALANLLANALRYSPLGRPPILAATASNATVAIEVIDFGPGVVEDQRARMVQPFQQIGDQRVGAGVGLGLAVAKGFVEAMAGKLLARTTLGGGLTMRIELPRCESLSEQSGEMSANPSSSRP